MKARARRRACAEFVGWVSRRRNPLRRNEDGGLHCANPPYTHLIANPQTYAAVKRVPDRLRTGGAVEEEIGNPALGDAEAEPAAIFEPALITDRGHDRAVAGHAGDDAGSRSEGLHPSAVDVGFDA